MSDNFKGRIQIRTHKPTISVGETTQIAVGEMTTTSSKLEFPKFLELLILYATTKRNP